MARFSRPGHKLIAETPYSLLSLTRHHVEPHEEHWFARCRADYLRNFPLSLLELVRVSLLLVLIGPLAFPVFTLIALSGWGIVMILQHAVRRGEAEPGFDEKLALKYRYS